MSEPKEILGLYLVFTKSNCGNQLRSYRDDFTQFCSVIIRILQLEFICEQSPGNQSLKVLAQKKSMPLLKVVFVVYRKLNSECVNEVISHIDGV